MIELSITLPTYNSAARLRQALRSLEQSDLDKNIFEVVVVDDGSTDDTPAAVREFAAKSAMNIRYFRRERDVSYGPGIARDEAMRHAAGHIIVFFDDDCIAEPDWLGRVYGYLTDGGQAVVSTSVVCPETLVFPWKTAPAGHGGFVAFDRRKTGDRYFSREFIGKCGNDTDFNFRLIDDGFRPICMADLIVTHPLNIFSLRRVWRSAWSRNNEVLLHKKYGIRNHAGMHPVFRPLLFGRLSPLFIAFSVGLTVASAVIIFFGATGVALVAGTAALSGLYFMASGYRFCLMNLQAGFRLSFKDRFRTLLSLAVYVPAFLAARLTGSFRFRHLMM